MIKKETYIFIFLTTILSALIFSLLYFLIPFPIQNIASHYINYSLMIFLAFIFVFAFIFGTNKVNELERLVLRLPLIKLVISFQIINLILSIIQAIINAFFKLPFYIPICVFSFELIVFFLIFIIKKQNVKHIENIDEKIKNSTYNIKELRIKSSSLLSFCKDDSSKENILIIIDKLKFSDPVSNDATTNVEKDIFNKLSLIENNLKNGVSVSSVDEVIELIEKRNIICKGNK